MGVPQMIMIGLIAFSLGINLAHSNADDGSPKEFMLACVGWALIAGILTWGGFWK